MCRSWVIFHLFSLCLQPSPPLGAAKRACWGCTALTGGCLLQRGAGTVLQRAAAPAELCAQGLGQSRRNWLLGSFCLGREVSHLPGATDVRYDEHVGTRSVTPGTPGKAFRGRVDSGSVQPATSQCV